MHSLTVAICDDAPDTLRYAASLVRRELSDYELTLDCFTSALALRKCLAPGDYRPDVAVLDIELGAESGIALAVELNAAAPDCRVIFLSGYSEYISAAYEAEHVWYVLKSQVEDYLAPALRRAVGTLPATSAQAITVTSRGKSFTLPLRKLLYISGENRRTCFVCTDESYTVSGSPARWLAPSLDWAIVRCHQSFWVNIAQVSSIDREEIVLHGGQRLPIGRAYRAETRRRVFARWDNNAL